MMSKIEYSEPRAKVLRFLDNCEEMKTASEIEDGTGVHRNSIYQYMDNMEEKGIVKEGEVADTRAWTTVEDVETPSNQVPTREYESLLDAVQDYTALLYLFVSLLTFGSIFYVVGNLSDIHNLIQIGALMFYLGGFGSIVFVLTLRTMVNHGKQSVSKD